MPSDGINGFRTTSINDKIEPVEDDLFAVAMKMGLDSKEAVDVFMKMQEVIKK